MTSLLSEAEARARMLDWLGQGKCGVRTDQLKDVASGAALLLQVQREAIEAAAMVAGKEECPAGGESLAEPGKACYGMHPITQAVRALLPVQGEEGGK